MIEEIKIKIKELEDDMNLVLNHVDRFTSNMRSASHNERIEQLSLLNDYRVLCKKKEVLEDVLETHLKNIS